ncbi:hypothetical protein SLEP1_g3060 [Rubroshorea leprosula]|uniref:Retrotransposon gag domain-containing protein n=1 Tax=Rubroshorea leprosula TaxID=152421 RepID=A0AAV5HSU6_9ROSI|nr:hypothetical protein SLEP1_g3060 [Rubroshorea leprosula]
MGIQTKSSLIALSSWLTLGLSELEVKLSLLPKAKLTHNSAPIPNQGDAVAAQLTAMQQQFGVFQLVVAQLLTRNNPGDPLINLLNPTQPYSITSSSTVRAPTNSTCSCLHLPPRSISSYIEMTSAFVTKFSSKRLIQKTTFELMRVMQRDGESLKNYMSRFNDAILVASSLDQAVRIVAVIQGLNHERFRDSLIKHPTVTFNEVNDRNLKFITVEEYALSQKPVPTKNQNPAWRDEGQSRKWMKTIQNRGPMSIPTLRFERLNSVTLQQTSNQAPVTWTPFNLPRS